MSKQVRSNPKDKSGRTALKTQGRYNIKQPPTKRDQLIRILSAKNGAEADAICQKLGWLPHTTRAAISGLRKSGFDIQSERPSPSKPRRYRIVANPAVEAASNAG